MNLNWWNVYEARYGKKLTEEDIAIWENEISHDISKLGVGEVTEAVRSIADDDRRAGTKRRFPPDVQNIVTAIIRRRFDAKKNREVPGGECGLCRDGWVNFYFVPDSKSDLELNGLAIRILPRESRAGMVAATYCRCTRGSEHLARAVKSGRVKDHQAQLIRSSVFAACFGQENSQGI